MVRNEYPEHWEEAITTLLVALNLGQGLVDMFLRILDAIDEEIINMEFHRSPSDTAVSMKVCASFVVSIHTFLPVSQVTGEETSIWSFLEDRLMMQSL